MFVTKIGSVNPRWDDEATADQDEGRCPHGCRNGVITDTDLGGEGTSSYCPLHGPEQHDPPTDQDQERCLRRRGDSCQMPRDLEDDLRCDDCPDRADQDEGRPSLEEWRDALAGEEIDQDEGRCEEAFRALKGAVGVCLNGGWQPSDVVVGAIAAVSELRRGEIR